MHPPLDPETGSLPSGIHEASWEELAARFGFNAYRRRLLDGLLAALRNLAYAGCESATIDGSFVTAKPRPGDYDGTWEPANVDPDRLDPVLLSFDDRRAAMMAKYLGELFPATSLAAPGKRFDELFRQDKASKTRTAGRKASFGWI